MSPPTASAHGTPSRAAPDASPDRGGRWHEIAAHGLLLRWRASGLQTGSRFWTPWTPRAADAKAADSTGPPRVLISPSDAVPPHGWPSLETPQAASEGVAVAVCPSGEGRYLLSYPDMPYPGGPVFQVEADRVLIHGGHETAPQELSWFLVGPVLSFLLAVRGATVFHGSAVQVDAAPGGGQGVVAAFIGPSGAGKSTLASALAGRGRAGVTDDLLVLEENSSWKGGPSRGRGEPWRVLPGAPRRLLWPDAARHLGNDPAAGGTYRWDKHALPAAAWAPRRPLPLGPLFYLRPAPASAEPTVRPMPASQATAALLGNLRLAWLAGRRRLSDLETVTRLVGDRGVHELIVPHDFDRLPAVLDLVEERLAGGIENGEAEIGDPETRDGGSAEAR